MDREMAGDKRPPSGRFRLACALAVGCTMMLALAATARAYTPGAPVWLRTVGSSTQSASTQAVAGGPGGTVAETGVIVNAVKHNFDILTVRYDAGGHRLFTQALNGRQNREDSGNAVACDRFGDVFVAGTIGVSTANQTDLVVLKYSPKGKLLWARTYDGPGHAAEVNPKLAVDSLGNVYMAGDSDLTGSPSVQQGIVVMKFDANGHRKWVVRCDPVKGSGTARWVNDMKLAGGDLYLCGGRYMPTASGLVLMTAYKVDTNGHVKWGRTFTASSGRSDQGQALAVHGDRVAVVGQAWNSISATSDLLLVTYDLAGHRKCAFTYHAKVAHPADQTDAAEAVSIDAGLDCYLTGACYAASAGDNPVFMTLKVDPRGHLVWGRILGQGMGRAICEDASGNIFVTGHIQGINADWATARYNARGVRLWLRTWNGSANSADSASGLVLWGTRTLFVGGGGMGMDKTHSTFQEAVLIRYDR